MIQRSRNSRGVVAATALVACLLALLKGSIATPAFPEPPRVDSTDLSGLWKAKRWFGPEVRGLLAIERRGPAYVADIAGRTVMARREGNELRFDLPGGKGSFRGRVQRDGTISGHWITPNYVGYGFQYASPVRLSPHGANQWRGRVVLLDDTFTLYLFLARAPDGSLTAVMQNPERDYGAFLGVRRLKQQGDTLQLIGKRPNWKGERVVAQGTYDIDNQVISLYFPDRGGTYDFQRDGEDSGFYPRAKAASPYAYHRPLALADGWQTASLSQVGIDQRGVERFIQKVIDTPMNTPNAPQVQAILIARHGKLVLDEYFHGFDRDMLHETRSAAKSITATLIGAAMHNGAPLSLSTRVYETLNGGSLPAGLDPRKRAMTLRNLMNMSSGFDCDDANPATPGYEDAMYDQTAEPDYVRYALRLPMAFVPGEKSVYCTQNANLALALLSAATGEFPPDLFDRLIATPLQIDRYAWLLDPAGNAFGGGSVKVFPRDFLKFAQLLLDGGIWHGRRILGRCFAATAVSPLYHLRGVTYGLFWWGIDYPYKNRTVHAFFAAGAGGQTVMAIPELDLVIGIFAGNYSSGAWKDVQQNYVPRYILPAVREAGDDVAASVIWREDYSTPYGHARGSGPVTPER